MKTVLVDMETISGLREVEKKLHCNKHAKVWNSTWEKLKFQQLHLEHTLRNQADDTLGFRETRAWRYSHRI